MIELAAWWTSVAAVACGALYHGGRLWFELFSPAQSKAMIRLGWGVTYAGLGWAFFWPWAAFLWLLTVFPR